MAISLVGGNSAENNGGSGGYTLPSTLSNSAAIAADDLIILAVTTADASNTVSVTGFTQIGTNNDGSGAVFYRKATGSESAGWATTFSVGQFATTYTFQVYRDVDPTTPFSPAANTTSSLGTAIGGGSVTVPASTTTVLVLTHFSTTGTLATAPTPSPTTTLSRTSVTNSLRNFLHWFYEATTAAGALQYTGTFSQTGQIETVTLVLQASGFPMAGKAEPRGAAGAETTSLTTSQSASRGAGKAGAALATYFTERQGSVTVDFGFAPNQVATVRVPQSTIGASQPVEAFMQGDSTADHNAFEHLVVPMQFVCSDVAASGGFSITAVSPWPLTGKFTVRYVW